MASGNYARKALPQMPIETRSKVPPRATRQLPTTTLEENEASETEEAQSLYISLSKALRTRSTITQRAIAPVTPTRVVDAFEPHPLERHKPWLKPFITCVVGATIFYFILLSAGMFQRPGDAQYLSYTGGKVYDVQVGGSLAASWQSDQPMAPQVPIPSQTGPYSVLGKPSISVDFINQVLNSYHSPAVGKGQKLYDLGVKYGIDPAYALAFFMHESTFGTAGEARSSLSLGNLRCIPSARCVHNYAWFDTWEDGFEAWYKLIRNLYVAQWGLVTVDQIIPKYAPNSDNNNENGYIAALKHYLDTWHAGMLQP